METYRRVSTNEQNEDKTPRTHGGFSSASDDDDSPPPLRSRSERISDKLHARELSSKLL